MTPVEIKEIETMVSQLRAKAASVGPQHAWWDAVFDLEALLKNEPTILPKEMLLATVKGWLDEQ